MLAYCTSWPNDNGMALSYLEQRKPVEVEIAIANETALDMSFNRRSLDWDELKQHSPRATPKPETSPSHNRTLKTFPSPQDVYEGLSTWNFPSQPLVPPRLLLWGPFNALETDRIDFKRHSIRPKKRCAGLEVAQQQSTPLGRTPKRRRECCMGETDHGLPLAHLGQLPHIQYQGNYRLPSPGEPPPRYESRSAPFSFIPNAPMNRSVSSLSSNVTGKVTTMPCSIVTPPTKHHVKNHPNHYFSSCLTPPIWSPEWHHTYYQFRNPQFFQSPYYPSHALRHYVYSQ